MRTESKICLTRSWLSGLVIPDLPIFQVSATKKPSSLAVTIYYLLLGKRPQTSLVIVVMIVVVIKVIINIFRFFYQCLPIAKSRVQGSNEHATDG